MSVSDAARFLPDFQVFNIFICIDTLKIKSKVDMYWHSLGLR